MTTELAAERGVGRALIVADALTQEGEQRKLLGQYVAQHMTEGVDYGVIPGTANKALLKPGAEKLTQLFRCIPRFTIEEKIEDWDRQLFYYRFACQILNQDGQVVAEGVGSCSTYESRYRWRTADRVCPACGKATIKRSKHPPRDDPQGQPGWYCFGKIGGCGANFAAADPAVAGQQTGRVQNPDLIDQANTVLKMAKKRAHVDAAITLARCSDIFTQDVEDLAGPEPAAQEQPAPAPRKEKPAANTLPATGAELHQRLKAYDATLVSRKLCEAGALLAHVTQAGVRAGYSANIADWSGPAIPFAAEAVKEFEKQARSKPAEPRPSHPAEHPAVTQRQALMELYVAKGQTWDDCVTYLNGQLGAAYDDGTGIQDVSPEHRKALVAGLLKMDDVGDAKE